MAETLRVRAGLVKELVDGFLLRFDPKRWAKTERARAPPSWPS
jgi:hypothetical protein